MGGYNTGDGGGDGQFWTWGGTGAHGGRVGQFGLPFVKYPQSDADACYNLEYNSELV